MSGRPSRSCCYDAAVVMALLTGGLNIVSVLGTGHQVWGGERGEGANKLEGGGGSSFTPTKIGRS